LDETVRHSLEHERQLILPSNSDALRADWGSKMFVSSSNMGDFTMLSNLGILLPVKFLLLM